MLFETSPASKPIVPAVPAYTKSVDLKNPSLAATVFECVSPIRVVLCYVQLSFWPITTHMALILQTDAFDRINWMQTKNVLCASDFTQ